MWLLAGLLALATIAVYWPATRCGFVDYDDDLYVTSNFHVQHGMSLENLKWVFINPVAGNWHPLTMVSHMLDFQFFGLNPWGHHQTSLLLHALNAMLVFVLLQQTTGAPWRSLLAAVLFAVHPLRVESVAWVAERKDVLSGCFGLLALIFYARYAQQRSKSEKQNDGGSGGLAHILQPSTLDYGLALILFALGLMSKPMLVTWPFVMLLLDYWPLQRFKVQGLGFRVKGLVVEKIPFFALAGAVSVVTFLVQKQGGGVITVENLPFGARLGNALISYCRYLGKMFWPTDMAVFYPHPGYWPMAQVLLAGALLCGISVLLWMQRNRYPFLLMGWLWFGGTLTPVIGLVQAGGQSMADRYTYMPSVGVLIMVIWGVNELTRRWPLRVVALAAGLIAVILCLTLTRQQLGYWRDSETLFRHAIAVTENNYIALANLGIALDEKGQTDEAIRQYQEVLRLKPDDADTHNNLGTDLDMKSQTDEAIRQYREALRLNPEQADAHFNLGNALYKQGQFDEATRQFQEVIRLKPENADARFNLGNAFYKQGRFDEAILQYQEALRLKPSDPKIHNNLGDIFFKQGRIEEAISQFQETLRLKPDFSQAQNNLIRAQLMRNAPTVR